MELFLIFMFLIIYFLPTLIARKRFHRNMTPIFLTNLFFGWTGLGWFIALIWSVSDNVIPENVRTKGEIKDFRTWKLD